MLKRVTSTAPFARVLRVVLVFALVFWSSFSVETLAFAKMYADSGAGHEAGTLSNLAVWEVKQTDDLNDKGEVVGKTWYAAELMRDAHDTAAGEEQKAKPQLQVNGEPMHFAAVPTWVAKPSPDEPSQESPSSDSPGTDEPSQESPSSDSPGTDEPSQESPSAEDPNQENPGTDQPDTDEPSAETPGSDDQNADEGEAETQGMPASTRPTPAAQGLAAQADEPSDSSSSAAADKLKDDVIIATFVEWKVGEGEEEIASIQEKDGVATLTAHKAGTVTVTCSLKESAKNLVAEAFAEEFPDKPFEVSFTVTVTDKKSEAPYVQSIELYTPDGTLYTGTDPVVVPKDQAASYALHEKVNTVPEPAGDAEPIIVAYDCTYSRGLSVASGGRFADLTWRAENPDGSEASKDNITVENGVITLKGNGTYTVWCISANGRDGSEYKTSIKVCLEGAVKDPQGEYNPQPDLTVEIDVPEAKLAFPEEGASGESADANGSAADGAGETAGSSGASADAADEGRITTQAEESSNASASGASSQASSSASDASASSPSASSPSASSGSSDAADSSSDAAEKTLKSTSKTYMISDLDEFTIKNADGKPDEYVMGDLHVKGYGPTLAALIYRTADPDGSLGLNPKDKPLDIESVEFVIAGGRSIEVPWTDLVAVSAPNNLILATESLVVVSGEAGLRTAAVEGEGEDDGAGAGENPVADPNATTGTDADAGGADGATGGADAAAPGDSSSPSAAPTDDPSSSSSAPSSESSSAASPGGTSDGTSDVLLPNTRFRFLYNGLGAGELADPDAFRYINKIVVHVNGEQQVEPEPPADSSVYIAYTPVRKGETARLIPQFTLPDPVNGGTVQFHYDWQWSPDNAPDSWQPIDKDSATDKDRGQQLEVLTNDDTIGTWRRFILTVTLVDGATREETEQVRESLPVQIEKGSGFRVLLDYVPPVAGDVANFTAIPQIDPEDDEEIDLEKIYYEWQMSTDYGLTWIGEGDSQWPELLKKQSGVQATTLHVPTKKIEEKPATEPDADKSDGSASSEQNSTTQLIWIRVVAHHNGKKTPSDPAPLTVHVGDTSGGKKAEEIQNEMEKGAVDDDAPPVAIVELDKIAYEDASATDVTQPPSQPTTTYGQEPTSQPTTPQSSPSQVYVNDTVTEQIAEQQEAAKNKPGARWTELSSVNPTDEDVKNILGVNPFAPFAVPTALGITAAGALEKLIGFRRQTH